MEEASHFQRVEQVLRSDEQKLSFLQNNETSEFKRWFGRSILTLTIVPTFIITYIVHLLNARAWYILLFTIVYILSLIFFIEIKFDFVIENIRSFQKYLHE